MANIKLVRVDYRLMHGQVVTGWLGRVSANSILIINDQLAADQFLSQVYLMAAPPGVKVDIVSLDEANTFIQSAQYIDKNLLILFKTIEDAYRGVLQSLPIEEIQVGGVDDAPDKKRVADVLAIDDKEIHMLKELRDKGLKVYFQVTTGHNEISLEKALEVVDGN